MGQVELLDCTLRDGGYVNDWRFGKAAIADMSKKLADSKVDILELGFLKNEPWQKDRTVFNDMDQVKTLIGKKRAGQKYAVMCEVVNPLPLEQLAPADESSADIIRVIVWKTKRTPDGKIEDALQAGYEYCKGIIEKGYRLCVQPARVTQYNDEEFVHMVKRFSELNPYAIYVVDSWGTQHAEGMLHYMHLADKHLPEHTKLGYHGHNNMMQALSIAEAMIKGAFCHDLIVDASVYGIGRGAGNLNLELIADYLNKEYGKDYDLLPMLMVYEKYIKDIYAREPWGYSLYYFLTALYDCNPNYAKFMRQEKIPFEDAQKMISSLQGSDKVIFSAQALMK